jgi:hypothetical protein
MKSLVVVSLLLFGGVAVLANASSSTKRSKTAARKTATTTRSRTGTARRASGVSSKRGRYVAARRRPAGPTYQTHPTPERYKEIQQALADQGYYKGEVNGEWNDDSVAALKKFQADHKLYDDGKISSLSLIQLGLGPKHNGSALSSTTPLNPEPPLPTVTEEPIDSQAVTP